ncbi:hypothetical protein [Sinorhizobium medicae]|uniref:hypothetical protein n=1 Tax=Sinorhizobium medicae TaxID=110321 RepID=UPI001F231528|nr:hypothetical protein [Sinorhizobium medicae]
MASAPFSQNSKDELCFGSGQAQPGQSNPSGWFAFGGLLNVARTKPGAGKFDLLADVDYLSSLLGNHLAAPKA